MWALCAKALKIIITLSEQKVALLSQEYEEQKN